MIMMMMLVLVLISADAIIVLMLMLVLMLVLVPLLLLLLMLMLVEMLLLMLLVLVPMVSLCGCAGRADPECRLGQLLKMLFAKSDFTDAVSATYSSTFKHLTVLKDGTSNRLDPPHPNCTHWNC